jgi:ABC-type amino acid transport substrate-binding protein
MNAKNLPKLMAALAAAVLFATCAGEAAQNTVPAEVRAKAAAIFAALEKIEAGARRVVTKREPSSAPDPGAAPGSRRLTFSEAEFNAWIACRLADEKEPYVKSAVFKLLAGDKVEGRVTIDLGKSQASGVLPQKQDLLFAARFETKEGMIRITLDSLYLGTQPITPAFVDIVIGVVSRLQGVEATSLKDWYDLPPGVLGLETLPGRVVVIY